MSDHLLAHNQRRGPPASMRGRGPSPLLAVFLVLRLVRAALGDPLLRALRPWFTRLVERLLLVVCHYSSPPSAGLAVEGARRGGCRGGRRGGRRRGHVLRGADLLRRPAAHA